MSNKHRLFAAILVVILVISMLAARIASAIPGAGRSATARVASGVISLEEKPVPPVVRIKSGVL